MDRTRLGWTGIPTFFGAPLAYDLNTPTNSLCAIGAPFGSTVTFRPGTHQAPRAIRENTVFFQNSLKYLSGGEVYDGSTNQAFKFRSFPVFDCGDIDIIPTNWESTAQNIQLALKKLFQGNNIPLMLGGDHTVTIPAFQAFANHYSNKKIGYVQIDHHFDFGNKSDIFGDYYNGSTSRRILEILGNDYRKICWIGPGDFTSYQQFLDIQKRQGLVINLFEIQNQPMTLVQQKFSTGLNQYEAIYLSIDVDVLDSAYMPGVSAPSSSGLSPMQLINILTAIFKLPIKAIDIVELAPNLDPSGNSTYQIAQVLYKTLFLLEGLSDE